MIMNKFIAFICLGFIACLSYSQANYSRQMQQAIRLYQEGKNSDAMDRFMDILVSGTPEEKAVANEYISKITQGVSPTSSQQSSVNIKTVSEISAPAKDTKSQVEVLKPQSSSSVSSNAAQETQITDQSQISKKVSDKIKQIRTDILVSLYRKNFVKFYMNEANEKPLYILLKEEQIFNENMTFNEKLTDDLKALSGLLVSLGRVSVTIIPNGAILGNMKISNVRKSSILHSFFTSYGISPSKIKLDMVANNIQVSKKVDDLEGILLIVNYDKEPDNVLSDMSSPGVYVSAYPEKIDSSKDEAAIVEFAVIMGKNPLASWKLFLKRKDKSGKTYEVQKIEGTDPSSSQILFNGREKIIGNLYPPGEYEFSLEASDVKGNNSFAKRSIYLRTEEKFVQKEVDTSKSKVISAKPLSSSSASTKTSPQNQSKQKFQLYKIYFEPDTFNITENSKIKIDQMMEEHKKAKKTIMLVGYAYSKEKNPKTTALKRANTVKNFITKNYKINPKNIIVNYKVVDIKKVIVEANFK